MPRRHLSALLDLVVPVECAGCRRPATRWCPRCDRALRRLHTAAHAEGFGGRSTVPGLGVWSWGDYCSPLDSVITAWKDGGRRDLTGLLAARLAHTIARALDEMGQTSGDTGALALLVPVPSSRSSVRRRGDAPLEVLTIAAVGLLSPTHRAGLRVVPALAHARTVVDQSRLGVEQRRLNLAGAMRVRPGWQGCIDGRRCIVVDDVVTTGATLTEAARALAQVGARTVEAAVVAATSRRLAVRSAELPTARR